MRQYLSQTLWKPYLWMDLYHLNLYGIVWTCSHYARLSRAMRAPWVDCFLNNEIYCYLLSKKRCRQPLRSPPASRSEGIVTSGRQQRNVATQKTSFPTFWHSRGASLPTSMESGGRDCEQWAMKVTWGTTFFTQYGCHTGGDSEVGIWACHISVGLVFNADCDNLGQQSSVHISEEKKFFKTVFGFLPEASIGLRVLSLPASVCLCVCPSVRQSWACPRDYSWPVSARITKFGP